jgi:hypothetical protein
MKKIYLTMLIVCTLLSNNSYSQEITDTVETELPCYNTTEIFKSLKEKHKEVPFMTGRAGDFANSIVSIWMNPVDATWTIIATKKDITCVIGMGTDMKIVPHKKGPNV